MTMQLCNLTEQQITIYTAARVLLTGTGLSKEQAESMLMAHPPSEVLEELSLRIPGHMAETFEIIIGLAEKHGV